MTVDRYLRMIAGAIRCALTRVGLLGEPVLVSVHGVCRPEPVPVGFHQLVPDDEHPAQVGREVLG